MYLAFLLGATALFQHVQAAPAGQVSPEDPRFTYYPFGSILSGPCDLTTGPDGAVWSSNILKDSIGRVDPVTGEVAEYPIPYANASAIRLPQILGRGAFSCVIQPGNDGFLYAASGIRNQLVKINPTTKEMKVFTPPSTGELPSILGNLEPFNDLWRGPEGVSIPPLLQNFQTDGCRCCTRKPRRT